LHLQQKMKHAITISLLSILEMGIIIIYKDNDVFFFKPTEKHRSHASTIVK
jgi:hypothetical protein